MAAAVLDPYGIAGDAALAGVAAALDPAAMEARLAALPRLSGDGRFAGLRAIRVLRHKPGRRCVIEYELEFVRGGERRVAALIGKARSRKAPEAGLRLMEAFWDAGFSDASPDGIGVPEPIAAFPELRLWLQRKAPGRPVTELLGGPDAPRLAERVAEAARKIHLCAVPPKRAHSMADELAILHERLPLVAAQRPDWERRIARLLAACDRLGALLPEPEARPIHRDFYADQALFDGARLYLIDFDLYCRGDPGVDIGNFLGHVKEQALRERGDANAYAGVEQAMTERFLALAGAAARPAVEAYTLLTLARHVHLSTLFEERRRLTPQLLALCEESLARWMP